MRMEVNKIYHGNCLEVMKTLPDNSIDSCVTDPPYGISFMNKHWDYQIPSVEIWAEVLRVLKPGGHLLCACGTRTQHRMTVNIEDAGFEIRDVITWHYGSGFPKSLDISKAIDKQSGAEREVVGEVRRWGNAAGRGRAGQYANDYEQTDIGAEKFDPLTAPSTDAAKQWEGYGTALKPATEFWTLARKPIEENTVAENVLKYGTGGLNIDGSRIEGELEDNRERHGGGIHSDKIGQLNPSAINIMPSGRFPANVIFDEFTGKILDEQSGKLETHSVGKAFGKTVDRTNYEGANVYGKYNSVTYKNDFDDSGGASRFFYCPKADNFERNKGLKGFELKETTYGSGGGGMPSGNDNENKTRNRNHHPTVKPIDLMRYLVKLITPKRGICIDPFCGSGTTLIGCKLELINYIGIEMNEEYCKIAEARVAAWNPEKYIEQTLF